MPYSEKPTSFAPVLIPTLCRYNHLKNCIESLMRCKWAEETDVFIGLDFPSKEYHWDGYNKIKNYLSAIASKHKFKSLNVFVREKNLGIGRNGNSQALKKYVLKRYDRFIFTEDDNIFSSAFLDYINKGLNKYEHDRSIFAICGYRHNYPLKYGQASFIRQNSDFNAWGYGMWKNRYQEVCIKLNSEWFRNKLTFKSLLDLKRYNGNNRAVHFIQSSYMDEDQFTISDIILSVYLFLAKRYVIMPKVSMVRNIGMDGSGENFHNLDVHETLAYSNQPLYPEPIFTFEGNGKEYFNENRNVYRQQGCNQNSIKNIFGTYIKSRIKMIKFCI